ncbi:MAG TPA: hypothetical protein VFE36_02790 [Candidatus Baltobacteraceae bacterium]|jgi:hypothetical protein|nr:hypothetical protein [Candidatus Baltobacteraceae bacterium]
MSDAPHELTVRRRDMVKFSISFSEVIPATWEDLQIVFVGSGGSSGRLSKFAKRGETEISVEPDGSATYSFTFTVENIDPLGTFSLSDGAIKLRDGFLLRYKPEFKGQAQTFTLTVVDTPERIAAVDATTQGIVN